MDEAIIVLRTFNPYMDEAYIYSSWRNSSYYSAVDRPIGESSDVFKEHSKVIKEILRGAIVRIACFQDSPEVIVGYSVSLNKHLYFIFVKPEFREKGIGKLLYPKDIETVTDKLTKIGKTLVIKKKLIIRGDTLNGPASNPRENRQADKTVQTRH